jgi:hypothetical protein
MGSGALIYVPSFIKIGSGIHKLIVGIHTHRQQRDVISLLWCDKTNNFMAATASWRTELLLSVCVYLHPLHSPVAGTGLTKRRRRLWTRGYRRGCSCSPAPTRAWTLSCTGTSTSGRDGEADTGLREAVRISRWSAAVCASKKFWEQLNAYFPRYDTGHIENDASNNSSIVTCVSVTAVTFLPSRCLATIRGIHRHTHRTWT